MLCFSVSLTIGIRALAQHEFERSNSVQRGEVRLLEKYFFGAPVVIEQRPTNEFNTVQQQQSSLVDDHLNRYLIELNLVALVVGGTLSYWFAGRALEPLAVAHEAQKRFASDASHELRTPLANMQVENEVFLRQKSFTEAEARELIGSNLEEVQRLETLATNLLSLTQYEQAALRLTSVPVRTVVDEAVAQAQKRFEARRMRLDQSVVSAHVLGHRDSLVQLLAIVLDNAAKYGKTGGAVYITGVKESSRYVLSVRDEGQGIEQADLPHIFDRLYRGDKARSGKTAGYGLGLALASEIAKANHADITAHNHPDGGAVFTVTLDMVGGQPR